MWLLWTEAITNGDAQHTTSRLSLQRQVIEGYVGDRHDVRSKASG